MKTFKDLEFKQHPNLPAFTRQAVIKFDNSYGLSVVIGPNSYGGREGLYEAAILYEDSICYTTHIANDVMGHLSSCDVTDIMKQVQLL